MEVNVSICNASDAIGVVSLSTEARCCRRCHDLAYASQNEDASDRASSKARKIRKMLGDDGGFEDPFPPKPKGMHWATYHRLEKECEFYEDQVANALWMMMGRLSGSL